MANHTVLSVPQIASVELLDLAIDKFLDYEIPISLASRIAPGVLVYVSLRGTLRLGIVIELKMATSSPKILPIDSIFSTEKRIFSEELFQLALWMHTYYCAPLRKIFKCMLPPSIRSDMSHKEQYFVSCAKPKKRIREECAHLLLSHPSQARILETLLPVKRGLLLTEVLEKAAVSKSPIESLVKKGLVRIDRIRIGRSPLVDEEYFKTSPKPLNAEQKKGYETIVTSLLKREFATHLLFGVTGSGKTEVYLQVIEKALSEDLGTIMLVPEISLTAQTIERFRARFDDRIAILHHRLSQGERYDEWHRIYRSEAKIVIGARSAVFSPVSSLGLIIVDEEHDHAYKQSEEAPCYHARDVAVMRGKLCGATVVLGTATPSLESYENAQKNKYTLLTLHTRATEAKLPQITIIDMKDEFEKAGGYTLFSQALIEGIKKRLEVGEQAILFLNRRGYHTTLHCKKCAYIFKCSHCELPLTFHLGDNALSCHLCGFHITPPPIECSSCHHRETLKFKGAGTEQIERSLHAILPTVRTLRIDGDTTRHKGSHDRLFRLFSTQKADVLIGTQMITKGLHFPAVTLVAILNTDASLHIPDFRSSEIVFQLVTQVAGRAGRDELPGEVLLQTHLSENPILRLAAAQDYESFFKTECSSRELFKFPPLTHLIKLVFSGKEPNGTAAFAKEFRKKILQNTSKDTHIHPVVPCGYAKIKDYFRFQLLIRTTRVYPVNQVLQKLLSTSPLPKDLRLLIDVDPLSTFF